MFRQTTLLATIQVADSRNLFDNVQQSIQPGSRIGRTLTHGKLWNNVLIMPATHQRSGSFVIAILEEHGSIKQSYSRF
jgi:hypothetical protein